VRYGFVVPWGDAADVADLAAAAEAAGWDALFVWEGLYGTDAWVSLGVAATRTSTIRLGTMLTPVSRRKPWELAGQIATVDRLSGGRVILTVGLGAVDSGFDAFGEETDRRVRARLLDEGLDVMQGLWKGQPFEYDGEHYTIRPSDFPAIGHTVQQPRPTIWCVGALGRPRSMDRAIGLDGLVPQVLDTDGARQPTLEELTEAVADVRRRTGERPFDVVVEANDAEHSPAAWAAAGATWWIESLWGAIGEADPVGAAMDRIRRGPPSANGS
jgi:alkanesulfonate monooxygenase SsuD/methylene tetrahydromethanopterin reductase-like flavin-dependent oxidoreductase (luciferase family)